jgi:hypothetical protein
MSILDLIIISILGVMLMVSTAAAAAVSLKHKRSLAVVAQLVIDKTTLLDELSKANFIAENSSDLNDGFIKFLSESRDMAFEYISDVQESIESLKRAMDLRDEAMITESYTKLISFLPSENQDVVN